MYVFHSVVHYVDQAFVEQNISFSTSAYAAFASTMGFLLVFRVGQSYALTQKGGSGRTTLTIPEKEVLKYMFWNIQKTNPLSLFGHAEQL